MMKRVWAVSFVLGLMLISVLVFSSTVVQIMAAPPQSPVPTLNIPTFAPATDNPATAVTPTATRERYALTKPATQEDIPEVMLTLTAFAGEAFNGPTPTDGPSKITLDGKPHFVDFNAWWCSPCNQMRPSIVDMKAKYGDKVTFDEFNVDNRASEAMTQKYQVEFIPLTVLLDKDGKVFLRLEGYQSKQELDDALARLVANHEQQTKQ